MNQRRRTRVSAQKQVTLAARRGSYPGVLSNLSLKGCLVQLEGSQWPRSDETLTVIIHLENDAPDLDVRVQGRVVRVDSGSVAVDFTEVELESFSHLFRLVQYNAPEPEDIEEELGTSAFSPPSDAAH